MTLSNDPSSSQADDADRHCESCGAPASWADYINLPLNARILHSFSTYLASPRMWPVGYIIGSPYSPLQLEIEIPERNWRDRFEDLIALETGGQMISNESREKEAEVFFRLLCQESHEAVLRVNEKLERYSKRISIYERAGNFAARRANLDMVSSFETSAHQTRMESQELFDSGQAIISELKKFEQLEEADKPKRSGPSMMKGHWIASLFSRGALPGWRSRLYDSHLGPTGHSIRVTRTVYLFPTLNCLSILNRRCHSSSQNRPGRLKVVDIPRSKKLPNSTRMSCQSVATLNRKSLSYVILSAAKSLAPSAPSFPMGSFPPK